MLSFLLNRLCQPCNQLCRDYGFLINVPSHQMCVSDTISKMSNGISFNEYFTICLCKPVVHTLNADWLISMCEQQPNFLPRLIFLYSSYVNIAHTHTHSQRVQSNDADIRCHVDYGKILIMMLCAEERLNISINTLSFCRGLFVCLFLFWERC